VPVCSSVCKRTFETSSRLDLSNFHTLIVKVSGEF